MISALVSTIIVLIILLCIVINKCIKLKKRAIRWKNDCFAYKRVLDDERNKPNKLNTSEAWTKVRI